MRLACYQPEIAGNMGAILRLAACYGMDVDVVEPCGFVWSDAKMRRAGMDYAAQVPVVRHVDWPAFRTAAPARVVLLTTKAEQRLHDFRFAATDTLLLGSESAGVPIAVAQGCDATIRIPISSAVRSLNLAVAAAIALTEALRQTGGLSA
jgi:tRNA (cytidine/uridine-2'-O-)-methyltransferase